MSPSPTEPAHLGNAAPLSNEQSSKLSHDADETRPSSRPPPFRKQPSSLLSKLLSPASELDESISNHGSVDDSAADLVAAPQDEEILSSDKENAGQTNDTIATNTETMAISPARMPPRNRGASPVSSFSNHRELLNGRRGRGTSLERTHKEKMVEELPKASFSTNPGDTGLVHPPTPSNTTPLSSISDHPPTDGFRAQYRSWRDTHTTTAEKTWSIGNQGSNDAPEGQVEKSIAEALAGVEPNNRSRKASYSVRLFREGLPEEKPKKREGKDSARTKDKSPRLTEIFTSNDYFGSLPGAAETSKGEIASSPTQPRAGDRISETAGQPAESLALGALAEGSDTSGEVYIESPQDYRHDVEDRPSALPAQLLDDLRKRHNLTPAAAKGLSFSGSLRVTESERVTIDEKRQEASQPKTPTLDKAHDGSATKSRSDEDDDSSEEQISSALFVPHQTSHQPHESSDPEPFEEASPSEKLSRRYSDADPEEWLVEHDVPPQEANRSPGIVAPKPLSPDLRNHVPLREDQGYFPTPLSSSETPSYDTYSDTSYTTKGEESSQTDDPGTTPTGTSKGEQLMLANEKEHLHRHQQIAKAPLDAIELIPYRHQVGGHTTMWRFSKRAVCKQLNNRENEFYERIEHNHPKLLKFMPRYVYFDSPSRAR